MWWCVAASLALSPHLYLSKTDATQFLKRHFQPQSASGFVFSVAGVKAYAQARIALERTGTGALVQDDRSFFVVLHDDDLTVVLARILAPDACEDEALAKLRAWHEYHFADAALLDVTP